MVTGLGSPSYLPSARRSTAQRALAALTGDLAHLDVAPREALATEQLYETVTHVSLKFVNVSVACVGHATCYSNGIWWTRWTFSRALQNDAWIAEFGVEEAERERILPQTGCWGTPARPPTRPCGSRPRPGGSTRTRRSARRRTGSSATPRWR